jgi:hypothetical protein
MPGGKARTISCSTIRFEDGMIKPMRPVMDCCFFACA